MRTITSFFKMLPIALVLVGCGSGAQELDKGYLKNAEAHGKVRGEIIGRNRTTDWSALSAADKDAFMKTFDGDEAKAKAYFDNVKAGPPESGAPQGR